MEQLAGNPQKLIQPSMKDIEPLWCKFRDADLPADTDLHTQYCELIQEAIGLNHTDEAFHLLLEGFESVKTAA